QSSFINVRVQAPSEQAKGNSVQLRTQTDTFYFSKTPSIAERKEFVLDFNRAFVEADTALKKFPRLAAFFAELLQILRSVPSSHLKEVMAALQGYRL
uniref:Uncharacterized protein n=1 Tax=Electrophorus electricus TaxID=8005 RepID=A0A4W4EP79_ELEEL